MSHSWSVAIVFGLLLVSPAHGDGPTPSIKVDADLLLKGGTLIDGTGAPGQKADVALKGDRIVAIGQIDAPEAEVIDVGGKIIAPGFIDLHSHSDGGIVEADRRSNLNFLRQGVTTVVTGNCGGGALDVGAYFGSIDKNGAGTNVIHLIPHGALRSSVMGKADREPTDAELGKMKAMVETRMQEGAWGISTGLIYVPSRYGKIPELVELSKVVARHGGLYASHIRNEGTGLLNSIEEALAIGEQAKIPIHISHLKASGKASWGLTAKACDLIREARKEGRAVSADQYPYVASSTSLGAMVVPHWALQGSAKDFARLADDSESGPKLRREIESNLATRNGGSSIRIARYKPKPSRVGRDLAAIAKDEGTTALEVILDIQRHGGAQAISFGMNEDDVRQVMKEEFVATASDGSTHVPTGTDSIHPRAYGTFPRKFRYALDDHVLSIEQAVRSCSGLPAEILQLPDRGLVRRGYIADLVVFDPNTFRDAATFDNPTQYAPGVDYLFVNGIAAIKRGERTDTLSGRALRLNQDGPPDQILKVSRIWTGDEGHPWAEAVAMRGGEIVAVGSSKEIEALKGPNTWVIEHANAFAMPGLIDAHGHLTDLGASTEEIDLRGVKSQEEVARQVKEWIANHPGEGWVTGQNWDQSLWPGGKFPSSKVLDEVAPNRPVWLTRVDGHAGWANSEALRRAKLTRESQAPADGQILRDAKDQPTGVIIDGAMGLVSRHLPAPTRADLARQILAGQKLVLEAGLTGVHDAGVSPLKAEVYRELDRAGALKLRVYGMASVGDSRLESFAAEPPKPAKSSDRFMFRSIKLFMDGAMGSRGALLFEEYQDDPGNKGLQLIDQELLTRATEAALRSGWQIATHAIGDRANEQVLDAYEQALNRVSEAKDARLRVEHAQVVRPTEVERFARLGVIASMQPSHAIDDMRWTEARLGAERTKGAYAWRWFLDRKVPLAFGSDFPVEVVNPFYGIYAAVTRQDENAQPAEGWLPEQRLSLEETLRAFTTGSAFASFDEERLGQIRPGLRADLTVVDRDLFQVKPLELLKTKVLMTLIDGEVVYKAPAK